MVQNKKAPPTSMELQHEIEQFLYNEAALLDDWQLEEWLTLFTADGTYFVPTTDFPEGYPEPHLALIDDDMTRLTGRVKRLLSRHAYREYPYSRTRRMISNIRVTGAEGDDLQVTASFIVYRIRMGQVAPYVGKYLYTLTRENGDLKIRHRRAVLDLEGLWDHGAVSIIL
ncbi:MAG: aromatic-ring-hydroxylating dioxygenase subunit beta [Chloroflexi bacterium]|jgi:p-cumate 2,3-dioxygenase beta subunit|nr:aromatic-ring-hydroxylating dioxygenase subunit beta [Chloroflexota bacterium]